MKVLLDENLPHDLRHFLPDHDVFTVAFKNWAGVQNGQLPALAAADGIDVFVTLDPGIEYEQNLATLPIAVIKLKAKSNKLTDLMPLVPALIVALATIAPKTLVKLP